jgi:hypothetical protein
MESAWTIAELAGRAAAALGPGTAEASGRRVNGRVRDLPNERLIRWYTTIGLVDPPLARRGRTALYGPRHLLQIVAVKRRQAAGRSIAEIQVELAGATDAMLGEIARLPAETLPPTAEPRSGTAAARSERARFWAVPPSPQPVSASEADDGQSRPVLVQGVRLAPGVTVLLDVPAASGLTGDDLSAIETAARPLLDELRRRGLLEAPAPSDHVPPDHTPRADVRSAEPPGRSS